MKLIKVLDESDLFTRQELSGNVGVIGGEFLNSEMKWLEFNDDKGKTLYVPTIPVKYGISFEELYYLGLVYGTDDNGRYTPTSCRPTNQLQVVVKDGVRYKVRLIQGSNDDNIITSGGVYINETNNSEWDKMFYPIAKEYKNTRVPQPQSIAQFTNSELNCNITGNGYMTLTQNTTNKGVIVRGSINDVGSVTETTFENKNILTGWRPVLEKIEYSEEL